jgi:O-antigen/teichoic acid export membrane protein
MYKTLSSIKTRFLADEMAVHGMIMVVFSGLAGIINYLFQLTMGIMLTPSQYGTLYSMLALFEILTVFSSAIHTSVTKFTSAFKVRGSMSAVNSFWAFSLKRAFFIGAAIFIVLGLLSPMISKFLNIGNYFYLLLLFFSFIPAMVLPVNYGVLRGLQKFLHLGSSNILMGILKLGLGALLVYIGLGVYGGLLTIILGTGLVFGLTAYFLRDVARAGNEKVKADGLQTYLGLALLATAAFTVLANIDIILVKHYLSQDIAGGYSVLTVLGRVAFVLPSGVVIAMFPKTSELFEKHSSHFPMLMKAVLLTILLAGVVTVIYWIFSGQIISFLYQGRYDNIAPYLFKYSVAMLFQAVVFLFINYFMSINRMSVAYLEVVAVLLQIILIVRFHANIGQIVNIMMISGGISIVLTSLLFLKNVKYALQRVSRNSEE